MYRICKSFRFEAAHQLSSAYSKECTETIHGHSYKVELFIKADQLNKDRMVVDFGFLKPFIEKRKKAWDHTLILPRDLADKYEDIEQMSKKFVILENNPTAEEMAHMIFQALERFIGMDLRVTVEKVRVHETETGWAEYKEI